MFQIIYWWSNKYRQSPNIVYTLLGYFANTYGLSLDYNNFKKQSGDKSYWMDSFEDFDFAALNVNIKNIANINNLSLELGRDSNGYGDKRVLGPGNWSNAHGWLWDLAKFLYKFNGNFIDVFYGQTKDKDKKRVSLFRKQVYEGGGFYSHFKTDKKGAIEPFLIYKKGLYNGIGNGNNTQESYTFGIRVFDKEYKNYCYDFTYAKSTGSIKHKDYDAYAYVAKVGYQFHKLNLQPKVVVGQIFASGDDNPHDNTVKTFRTPFGGTDGSLYGRMDIMKWSNLIENVVELHLFPKQNTHIKLSYHNFKLANSNDMWSYYKKYNKAGNHYDDLGNEYDIEYKYKYSKKLKLQAIYAYFDAGDFVKYNVDNNNAQKIFLQLRYLFGK